MPIPQLHEFLLFQGNVLEFVQQPLGSVHHPRAVRVVVTVHHLLPLTHWLPRAGVVVRAGPEHGVEWGTIAPATFGGFGPPSSRWHAAPPVHRHD